MAMPGRFDLSKLRRAQGGEIDISYGHADR
jgi:hypothetical protein